MVGLFSIIYLITVGIICFVLSQITYSETPNYTLERPILKRHKRVYACLFE